MSRYELRFSGAGGQGLITAGIIMAKAASIYEGKQAVQSQSYGPEARGGASKSEVIISDSPIDYPKATVVDACLAMTQESADAPPGTVLGVISGRALYEGTLDLRSAQALLQ